MPGGTLICSLHAVGLQRHQWAASGEVNAECTQVSLKPPGKSSRKPLKREIRTCTQKAGTPGQTIEPPPDRPVLLPLSVLLRVKNHHFFPQHPGISLRTGTWICLFCCTFSAIQSSTCLTFLPGSAPSSQAALCSAEHTPGFIGLPGQQDVVDNNNKVWLYMLFISIHCWFFPSHNFKMLLLTFLTSFNIFLFILLFTAHHFSSFFPPIPQISLPASSKKNELPVKFFFFSVSSPFLLFQPCSLILSFLPLIFLTTPRDVFPQLFADLFAYTLTAFGWCPHSSRHVSYQLPDLTHAPGAGMSPAAADVTPRFKPAQF